MPNEFQNPLSTLLLPSTMLTKSASDVLATLIEDVTRDE
jgi:hypothetical protein